MSVEQGGTIKFEQYLDPSITLENRITLLKQHNDTGQLMPADFAKYGLLLARERFQTLYPERAEAIIGAFDTMVQNKELHGKAFGYGMNGGEDPTSQTKQESRLLASFTDLCGAYLAHKPYVLEIVRFEESSHPGAKNESWKQKEELLQKVEEQNPQGGAKVSKLVGLELLHQTARDRLVSSIEGLLLEKIDIQPGYEESFWQHKMYGKNGIVFNEAYMMAVSQYQRQIATEICAANPNIAPVDLEEQVENILKIVPSLVFMRIKDYPDNRDENSHEMRMNVFKNVAEGDIDEAYDVLQRKMAIYPDAFTDAAKRSFGFSDWYPPLEEAYKRIEFKSGAVMDSAAEDLTSLEGKWFVRTHILANPRVPLKEVIKVTDTRSSEIWNVKNGKGEISESISGPVVLLNSYVIDAHYAVSIGPKKVFPDNLKKSLVSNEIIDAPWIDDISYWNGRYTARGIRLPPQTTRNF